MDGRSSAVIGRVRGLYAIIDTARVGPGGVKDAAMKIIMGGGMVLQLRAKGGGGGGGGGREVLKAARELRTVASENGALFIVNDRVDVALISRADGVHLGQDDIPLKEARRLLGEASIIGVSTHDVKEALRAESEGADYISFGPVFETRTKKDALAPRGIAALKEVRRALKTPMVAVGGITEGNMADVLDAGADAVAMISGILSSADITGKVSSIVSRIGALRKPPPPPPSPPGKETA